MAKATDLEIGEPQIETTPFFVNIVIVLSKVFQGPKKRERKLYFLS